MLMKHLGVKDEILRGVYPEILHSVQNDNRRTQNDISIQLFQSTFFNLAGGGSRQTVVEFYRPGNLKMG